MNTITADRLAQRCRGGAGHGARARWAWRRLSAAGGRGDQAAIDAVWQLWLSAPDAALLEALSRWRRPATEWPPDGLSARTISRIVLGTGSGADRGFPAALAHAAARTGHPIAEIARERILGDRDQSVVNEVCAHALNDGALAEFCARQRLAPADPVQRAVFFMLTGQAAQRRAADPDGSLLALGYAGASADLRQRLRVAMVGSGELDLMRVVVADRPDRLNAGEVSYLADRLAERGDWDGLWRLVQHMPLPSAVTVMRRFAGEEWRPGDPGGRAFFDRLARASPDAIARARYGLLRPPYERIVRIPMPGEVVTGCFSPDRRRLTVLVAADPDGSRFFRRGSIHVFGLPSGERTEVYSYDFPSPTSVVDLGDACLVAVWAGPRHGGLERCSNGRRERLEGFPGPISALALHGDGFAALQVPWRPGPREPRVGARLLLCDRGGRVVRSFPFPDPHDAEVFRCMGFVGPDRLLTGHTELQSWHLDGGRLVHEFRWKPQDGVHIDGSHTWRIMADPWSGRITVLQALPGSAGKQMWELDAETLAVTRGPIELGVWSTRWNSADGEFDVLGGVGFVDVRRVHDPLEGLADRRLSELTPADLGPVARALGDPAEAPGAGPFLELLHAWLEYRFATEVGVGGAAPVAGGPDDIGLAADGERS